jgi:hypothetical protein
MFDAAWASHQVFTVRGVVESEIGGLSTASLADRSVNWTIHGESEYRDSAKIHKWRGLCRASRKEGLTNFTKSNEIKTNSTPSTSEQK